MKVIEFDLTKELPNTLNYSTEKGKWVTYTGKEKISSSQAIYLEVKDLSLFDELGEAHDVPLELSPLCVEIMKDGLKRFGPRVWSSMVVKRLEDACGEDLRAPGFPEYLTDNEPEAAGAEVIPMR